MHQTTIRYVTHVKRLATKCQTGEETMKMSNFTNSPLVTYTSLSPNHSGQRNHDIDTITIHCVVGHLSLETIGALFANPARQASCNYAVDDLGRVGMYCEEKNRSWCTSSKSNDHRAITIEVACDKYAPYRVTPEALNGLIKLCADICKRNNIKQLLWRGDKKLIGQVEKQNMSVHRWFKNKACPGDYLYGKHGYIAKEVNSILNSPETPKLKPFEPYTVRVNTAVLNYRKGPGTNYVVCGVVKRNEVYTIVEESAGSGSSKWGKLKSGAGWLSLSYCQRL